MAQEIADSTLLETWSSGGNIVEPDSAKIIEGWQLGEQPPHEYMNWLQNTFGSKLNHILKNGVAKWDSERETEYLMGSSVQHNGNVWLCKATNKNSEPTDANANWKRTITVESLATVLGGYVKNSGDEDIDGIKNFLESPIVPTPTTGTQVANKDYVDSVATLNINALDEKITPVDTDNMVIQEAGGLLKKLSWANLKATLLTYFDNFYSRTTSIFGIGQNYSNLTGTRLSATTYTNTDTKPRYVILYDGTTGTSGFVIDGNTILWYKVGFFVVPAGKTYRANFVGVVSYWAELS